VKLYAESSAPLAWLLEQEHGRLVADALAQAELVIASDLTVGECDRVLIRAVALEELQELDAIDRHARLNAVVERWTLLSLDEEILEPARRPFPVEPGRTLDAIHLSSALTARKAVPDVALLTLDARIRQAARRLGFGLVPTSAELGETVW
jgi:PIN domain